MLLDWWLNAPTLKDLQWPQSFLKPCRHLLAVCLSNVGALTSRNPMGLHSL
jgi:hypothetical protein